MRPLIDQVFKSGQALLVSYLRGDYYIWADVNDRIHLWAADGEDGWEDSGWAIDSEGKRRPNAGGISLPDRVLDEYVMMRIAQLIEAGEAADALDRALRHGNLGGEALKVRAKAIRIETPGRVCHDPHPGAGGPREWWQGVAPLLHASS